MKITIAEIAIDLERGQSVVECKLRAPGIIRAAAFWEKTLVVLGSATMRPQRIAMPLLFVECSPDGEMQERVLLFLPGNAPFAPRPGYRAEYRTTAIQAGVGCIHVYELVGEVTP